MKHVEVYCDGSCFPNPGPGGWAAVLSYTDTRGEVHTRELSGPADNTTNSRMEMTAAIQALRCLTHSPCDVTLHSDSQYLIFAFTKGWLENWARYGWKGGAVKNRDLWEELLALDQKHQVTWVWVRGHAGNPGNERADFLAGEQRLAVINGRRKENPGPERVPQIRERGG